MGRYRVSCAALILFLPFTAFGTITAIDCGIGSDTASATTIVIVPTTTVHSGSTGIITLAMDNATASATNLSATSYTDSVGNIWYVRADAFGTAANATQEAVILSSVLTHDFTSSDSLTINFVAASVSESWTITEATPSANNVILFTLGVVGGTNATGTPTVTTFEASNGDLVFGMGAAESADTWTAGGDADTLNGTWSTPQHTAAGTGTTGMSIISQWKVVNAYGAQTWNPTLTSCDVRLGYAIFTEANSKARAISANTTTEAATVITFTRPISAGSVAVLVFSVDNAAGTGGTTNLPTPTVTDTKSNVWTLQIDSIDDPAAASAGVELGVYTGIITTPIVVGDTLTLTYTGASTNQKTWGVWEFAPQSGGTMSVVTAVAGASANTASPSVTTGTIALNDYVVGVCASEGLNTYVEDSDTTNGTWMKGINFGKGAATAVAQSIVSQWKQVSAAATQSYDVTISGGAQDTRNGWVEIAESVTGPTASQKSAFFFFFP